MKKALLEPNGRIAQIEPVNQEPQSEGIPFPVAPPLFWVDCAEDVTMQTHYFDGTSFVLKPPPPPAMTAAELEQQALLALNGGSSSINLQKLVKATVISDLAFRLGKAPGALTGPELLAERSRIAAIYKTL